MICFVIIKVSPLSFLGEGSQYGTCNNCIAHAEELEQFKTGSGVVPQKFWEFFSAPSSKYVMEILRFCGYETYDSVIKLKKPGEIEKMLNFVKENVELIDDKSKILGFFEKDPSKLKLLPGVEPILQGFITSVEKARDPRKRPPTTLLPKKKVQRSQKNRDVAFEENDPLPAEKSKLEDTNTENLIGRINKWIKDQNGYEEAMEKCKINLEKAFTVSKIKGKPENFEFKCAYCRIAIILHRKTTGKLVLANVYRHIKDTCWLNPEKQSSSLTKSDLSKKSSPQIDNFFSPSIKITEDVPFASSSMANENIPKCSISVTDVDEHHEDITRPPPPENTVDFHKKDLLHKRVKLEPMVESTHESVGHQNSKSTSEFSLPKNLLAPAGTQEHLETSGR